MYVDELLRFQKYIEKFTFPVCNKYRNYQFIATCFCIYYRKNIFILNAAHTFEKNNDLYIRIDNKYLSINEAKTFEEHGMDLAITHINKNFNINRCCNIDNLIPYNIENFNEILFFGYPASKYKPYAHTPRAEFMMYRTNIVNYKNKFEEYYVVGNLNTKNIKSIDEKHKINIINKLPGLKGLSGGPVFSYNSKDCFFPYFVGIGIKNIANKYIIALKYDVILKAINSIL